jgi:hypothetical protein
MKKIAFVMAALALIALAVWAGENKCYTYNGGIIEKPC